MPWRQLANFLTVCLVVCLTANAAQAAADAARLQTLLTEQHYADARPGLDALLRAKRPDAAERGLVYQWLFARDDGAAIDRRTHGVLSDAKAEAVDLLAAGRLALDRRDFERARNCFEQALARATLPVDKAQALRGLGQRHYQLREFDASLQKLEAGLAAERTADGLSALAETLIRLGRTEDAIAAAEQAVALNRHHEMAHYLLGNGYARENYSQLAEHLRNWPHAPQNPVEFPALMLDVKRASDAFERGDFDAALAISLAVLERCPQLGRAHAIAAKALESQRFAVDVHRADYERRFAAMPTPVVPGIERYVLNWKDLSPRHQKRVALSVAPWKAFIPVLVEAGATHFIKPMWMRLSETPHGMRLKDARIDYDSRLWDDVRGMGGYATVTGIEDVERSIFDKYNTVLHELTHQVHGVLTAEQVREIEAHYQQAKARDAKTRNGFLSRYAGGSVWEYFAEGANAEASPRRDTYDGREIVRERLIVIDPALRALVKHFFTLRDTRANLPAALVNAGNDKLEDGWLADAVPLFERALKLAPDDESALAARLYALALAGDGAAARELSVRALARHPHSGALRVNTADALWHGGAPLATEVVPGLAKGADALKGEDRFRVDLALADHYRRLGDVARALAAYEAVLAYQGDQPEALWGRAATLALAGRWDDAFKQYDAVLRLRTGLVPLRRDYALDLLRAGLTEPARAQLKEALILDPRDPDTLALKAWLALVDGDAAAAQHGADEALAAGPWSDLAVIVRAAALQAQGQGDAARAALAPLQARIAAAAPPQYVYRPEKSAWASVHELPASERRVMELLLK
ncbi:tetratricopeptide repeat protein [Roseateles saccharophilus]|uniref:Tetratricopeptide repeat protein n=2 Tax=Pseudomonadota TaxID=1224 RepID=A0A4R3UH83_ROSSA|nr:tetratricopeptide repeat protein [Roseateles saccharophilus]MDG0835101.1 tetratricopeptide repeat protein [Roseateles saccharophilus]TCU88279.1 tetratricopeptide repeat protein [Roseateles saccharophilus]